MSYRQKDLLMLPWRMVFKFRSTEDLDDFTRWAVDEYGGFDLDEMVVNRKTRRVIFTLELIEAFADMTRRATFLHHVESIRLNKYQPKPQADEDI